MILTLFIVVIALEIFEHIAFPIVWSILIGRKKSTCGVEGMIGKTVEILRWNKTKGKVLFKGELWSAECEVPMPVGSKAEVRDIEKLTLKLKPHDNQDETKFAEI
jgi:membrane-bound ClpP family serine protease